MTGQIFNKYVGQNDFQFEEKKKQNIDCDPMARK